MEHLKREAGEVKEKKAALWRIGIEAGILLFAAAMWMNQRQVPFMMDDLWYGTNLVTEEPLEGLADVVESQVWHFLNWGGRCMTHGILQLVLMQGELAADSMNLAVIFLLGWLVCAAAGQKTPFWLLTALSMIVALNPNVKMSMLWQSGTVNYVYSSAWILMFLLPYFRHMENPEGKALPLAALWMLPLGLLAGWSNENMGPACFVVITGEIIYLAKKKLPIRSWMIWGAASCLAGSILVVAAPGNFVRSAAIEKKALGYMLYDRVYSMLRAGVDFLFPAAVLLAAVLLIWMAGFGKKLRPVQWQLLALAVLSYGAMVLSPHYPDRAVFGTMIICIILTLSVLKDLLSLRENLKGYIWGISCCYWCYAMFIMMGGVV